MYYTVKIRSFLFFPAGFYHFSSENGDLILFVGLNINKSFTALSLNFKHNIFLKIHFACELCAWNYKTAFAVPGLPTAEGKALIEINPEVVSAARLGFISGRHVELGCMEGRSTKTPNQTTKKMLVF